jgi:threonine-phosphate decarboxylase
MEKNIFSFAKKHGISENIVVDTSSGISPVGPSRKVKASIRKALKKINLYPDPQLLRLKKLFSSKFGIAGDSIIFANSLAGFLHLTTNVLQPRKVLVVGPAPDIYAEAARASGAEVMLADAGESLGFDITAEGVMQRLKGVDMVFLSNPNRITGKVIRRDELAEILRSAAVLNIPVVLDESLGEFVQDDFSALTPPDYDNVIVARTTAHFYGLPGLELAYAVSSAGMIARLSEKNLCPVNTLAAEAARTALKDNSYRRLARKYVYNEMQYLARSLKRLPGIKLYPSDTNVLLIKLQDGKENIIKRLARAGFFILDYKDPAGIGDLFLRIAVLKHDKNVKLVRILAGKDIVAR